MSDRDVLVVGEPSPELDRAIERWSAREWNVSVFSRPAFERLAEVKALFVQHLKQEGRVICDNGGFIGGVFATYSPKSDYSAERNDALVQIISLPKQGRSHWHAMCLADAMYVLFRNAAILHLASLGEYEFRYDRLVERMAGLFELKPRQHRSLLLLRGLKHSYRRRSQGSTIGEVLRDARGAIIDIRDRLPEFSASSVRNGTTTDEYFNLRLAELSLLESHHPSDLDTLPTDHALYPLWRRIRFSSGYPKPKLMAQ